MNKTIIERVKKEAIYIVETNQTVRQLAKVFKVSKSTVHKDLTERLFLVDKNSFKEVELVLKYHAEIRHIRGGESTRQKYLNN